MGEQEKLEGIVEATQGAAEAVFFAIGRVFAGASAFGEFVFGEFGDLSSLLVTFLAKVGGAPTIPRGDVATKLAFVFNVVSAVFGARGGSAGALGRAGAAN